MADQAPPQPTINAIVHHDYFSNDPKATQTFFERMFGWKFQNWDETYALFEGPDGTAGGIGKADGGRQPGSMNYVAVENLAKTVEQAKSEGAQVAVERQEVPGMGALAVLILPGGVMQGLWETAAAPQ